MTLEAFLEGHVRAFEWLGGVPRECVYDNLRAAVARREGNQVVWNPRFLHLRGHYAFHATACTPRTPREKGSVEGSVRHLKSGFWPAEQIVPPPQLRPHTPQFWEWELVSTQPLAHALRPKVQPPSPGALSPIIGTSIIVVPSAPPGPRSPIALVSGPPAPNPTG